MKACCQSWAKVKCRCFNCDRAGWADDYSKEWEKAKAKNWKNLECDSTTDRGTPKPPKMAS